MVPSVRNEYGLMSRLQAAFITFLMFYTNKGWQIVFNTVSYVVMIFLVIDFEMQESDLVNFKGFLYVVGLGLFIFVGCSLVAMIFVYVIDLHLLLKRYIS